MTIKKPMCLVSLVCAVNRLTYGFVQPFCQMIKIALWSNYNSKTLFAYFVKPRYDAIIW